MTEIPLIGGTAAVVGGIIVGLFRWLLQHEIQLLREQVGSQAQRITQLEVLYDEQRAEKHRLNNELGQAQMLLGVVIDLAKKCTCGALDIVRELIDRAASINTPMRRED